MSALRKVNISSVNQTRCCFQAVLGLSDVSDIEIHLDFENSSWGLSEKWKLSCEYIFLCIQYLAVHFSRDTFALYFGLHRFISIVSIWFLNTLQRTLSSTHVHWFQFVPCLSRAKSSHFHPEGSVWLDVLLKFSVKFLWYHGFQSGGEGHKVW